MGDHNFHCDQFGGGVSSILLPLERYVRDDGNDARIGTRQYIAYYCHPPRRGAFPPVKAATTSITGSFLTSRHLPVKKRTMGTGGSEAQSADSWKGRRLHWFDRVCMFDPDCCRSQITLQCKFRFTTGTLPRHYMLCHSVHGHKC